MKTINLKTIQERQALELKQLEVQCKIRATREKYLLIVFGVLTAIALAL